MGVAERREREKARRRVDIIDAAERVFFSRGVEAATMDEVAEAAELSKGTLYLYFKNKEDLYLAIIMRGMELLKSSFEKAVGQQDKGIDKVAAVGRAYFEFGRTHPDYFNAMMYESSKAPSEDDAGYASECDRLGDALFGIVAGAVQAGIDDGTVRDDVDPLTIALTLYGLSTGLQQIVALKGERILKEHGRDPQELVETFFSLVETSLRTK